MSLITDLWCDSILLIKRALHIYISIKKGHTGNFCSETNYQYTNNHYYTGEYSHCTRSCWRSMSWPIRRFPNGNIQYIWWWLRKKQMLYKGVGVIDEFLFFSVTLKSIDELDRFCAEFSRCSLSTWGCCSASKCSTEIEWLFL